MMDLSGMTYAQKQYALKWGEVPRSPGREVPRNEFIDLFDEIQGEKGARVAFSELEAEHYRWHGRRRYANYKSFLAHRRNYYLKLGIERPPLNFQHPQATDKEYNRQYWEWAESAIGSGLSMNMAYIRTEQIHQKVYGHKRYAESWTFSRKYRMRNERNQSKD